MENPILKSMMAEMERQIEQYFYRSPVDRTFVPKLEAFLKQWEENFAPYILVKFDYAISFDGQHLDISATIPEPARYVINFIHRNYRRTMLDDDPRFQYGF
jgi:hypothetical protein